MSGESEQHFYRAGDRETTSRPRRQVHVVIRDERPSCGSPACDRTCGASHADTGATSMMDRIRSGRFGA